MARRLMQAMRQPGANNSVTVLRGVDKLGRHFRDAQSEILRAFLAFEQNRDLRFKRLKAEVANLDQEANGRIDNIEHRLMAIEKKLLLDPPRRQ